MDFKSPYFLIALLCLAIPVIIHLFNLRKYKKMYFPSLRMLEEMDVKNKKLSKIQKWALFLSRFLAVLFLVLAFAHPFFKSGQLNNHKGQKVIYIDNSMSSTYRLGQKIVLDELKSNAIQWIKDENINDIIILTNESLNNYVKYDQNNAIDYIKSIKPTPFYQSFQTVYNSLEHITTQSETEVSAVFVSDNQTNVFPLDNQNFIPNDNINLYSIFNLNEKLMNNTYIDTSYFIQTPTESDVSVQLVSEIKKVGAYESVIDLNYSINGQTISQKNISISAPDSLVTDTQSVNLKQNSDNNIHISFQSKELEADDNYYISAQISNHLKVGIINEGSINPQLTQALNSSRKIFPEQFNRLDNIQNSNDYSLIFFNNITQLSESDINLIIAYLQEGQSFAFSLDKNADITALNQAFEKIGNISINGIDTSVQNVADIEINHPLIKDVISKKPDNLQMPIVNYRYKYSSTLNARPQDLMRFRDGTGFITQFNVDKGIIYLFASPIDLSSNNLSQSYYFAPILYKMSTNSRHSDLQSYEISDHGNIWINATFDENTILNLVQETYKSIPIQKKEGNGVRLHFPPSIPTDSFYQIVDNQNQKLLSIGVNYDRSESITHYLTSEELDKNYNMTSVNISHNGVDSIRSQSMFQDLWKWALAFVLLALMVETYLLIRK